MNTIVKTVYGSHLYGTSTPKSDKDFKGVFMPSKKQVFLGKIPKTINQSTNKDNVKNTSQDVDCELYSLHYFIHLACEGQTVALDMLHTPKEMIIESSPVWDAIVRFRAMFYTKNLKAFVGYAKGQSLKYSMKGTKVLSARRVSEYLHSGNRLSDLLSYHWDYLPEGEGIIKHRMPGPTGERYYEICGKKIGERVTVEYAVGIVDAFITQYGKRALMAAENDGVDWKAISHAFRAAYEVKQLLTEGTITFPLKEATELLKIKNGEYDYRGYIEPKLDTLLNEVQELSDKSSFPEKVDTDFWDYFIVDILEKYM